MKINVKFVEVITAIAKKTGNEYSKIRVHCENGYQFEDFLTAEQLYILKENEVKEKA